MWCILIISLLCFNIVNIVECYHLCNETTVSCSYQLWEDVNISENACEMLYYPRNSPACQDAFPEKPKISQNQKQKGIIQLMPFVAEEEQRTVFKITAFNITWTNFKFRFKQQNTQNKCMKREFILQKQPAKDKFLIYDCPWANSAYEDKNLEFEYSLGLNNIYENKRTFLVHVPKAEFIQNYYSKSINDLELFSYIETTNPYEIILKFHISHLNITDYEIYVNLTRNNSTNTEGPFVKDVTSSVLGVIDFKYSTYGVPGEYVFQIRPYDCTKCRFSQSPVFIIPETSVILTIGIVSLTCLIPILVLMLYINLKKVPDFKPRILLVTTPANSAHKTIGTTLSKLLKEKHNMEVMLDITDIKTTKISPSEWLKKSFDYATHIVILVSDDKPPTSVYRNMDQSLYRLLEINPEKKSCLIEFPFSKPPKLNFIFLKKFQLIRDYTLFINFLKKRNCLHNLKNQIFRKNLFNELVQEINNYTNNINIINKPELDFNETENYEKEINHDSESEEQDGVPQEYRKIAENFALNPENSEEETEIIPHPDVLALLNTK